MKQRFIAGDTMQVGDDGKYEAGIHDTQGDHQGRNMPETWWQRIVAYGETAEEAEELRDMILAALSASPAPSGEVEAVEVVGFCDPSHIQRMKADQISGFMVHDEKGEFINEPLMTVAQHQRIVAALESEINALRLQVKKNG